MEIALLITVVLGLVAILLSFNLDRLKKHFNNEKKSLEDRIYKLSVLKEIQEKIAYMKDPETVIDLIMTALRNFFAYSVASSMVIKDAQIIFKLYIEDNVGNPYVEKVKTSMLSSFEKLIGQLPEKINKKLYGLPLNETVKSTYSSSFHVPLIANNKVLALIHLSSTAQNAFKDIEDLREIVDTASSCLTHFGRSLEMEIEKFSSLLKSMNEGILIVDNKNNLLVINNSAKNILGISENASFSDLVNAISEIPLGAKINEVITSKNPYFAKEIKINNKVLNIFINPIGNDRVSMVLRNISDYKKKEMLKEDLIHVMVHELRAPVTTIKDSAELIISTKDTLEETKKLKFVEIIHQQAREVLTQIGSILDTAKLDAGKLVLQKTKGDIEKLIKEEIKSFMPQAERKNISLSFELLAKPLPLIFFDEIRIAQVLDNLLSNSLKFTPEAGKIKIELDYKFLPPHLDSSPHGEFLSLDKYIVISVSDTGIGISKEQQKLLFTKYTQAKNTTEELATTGTGLGLYLIKGIVESHDGRIWVKSERGSGTTFSFALPPGDDSKSSYAVSKPFQSPLPN